MSKGRQNYVGVWEDGQFIGAVVFARSSSTTPGDAYGLSQWECIELTRVALKPHRAAVSRIVAIALRMLRERNPGLRLVLSYADRRQGHHGGIYQAGGWLYVGTSTPRREFWLRGKWRTDVHAWRMRTDATPSRRILGKHKYLMPLDAAMRAQLAPLAQPYPKRPCATSITADAPAVQAGDGGSTPTVALPVGLTPRRVEAGA